MKRLSALLLLLLTVLYTQAQTPPKSLSLAGTWQYQLDSLDQGISQRWFVKSLSGRIKLPGTLDDAGIGPVVRTDKAVLSKDIMGHLARKHRYIGPA